jgi:hypothetical protein
MSSVTYQQLFGREGKIETTKAVGFTHLDDNSVVRGQYLSFNQGNDILMS